MSKIVTAAAASAAVAVAITYNQAVSDKGRRTQTALSISRNGQMSCWTRIREGLWDDAVSLKDALLLRGVYNDNTDKYIERGRDDLAQQIVDSVSTVPPQIERSTRRFSSMDDDEGEDRPRAVIQDGKSIFHWGFNEIERAKAVAIGEFDEVNKRYNELLQRYKQTKSSILSPGDRELKKQVDQCKKLLDEKREALHKASEAFNNYTRESFNEISDKIDKQDVLNGGIAPGAAGQIKRKDLWNWMNEDNRKGSSTADVDRLAAKSVAGWGERAQEFAEEEIAERQRSMQPGPSEAQRRLDELKKYKESGWFTYKRDDESEEEIARRVVKGLEGWGDSAAQFAKEEYEELKWNQAKSREQAAQAVDNALRKLNDAKAEADKNAAKWWQFGKDKKDELHKASVAKYEDAKKEYEDSKSALEKWTNKQQGKFWNMANDSVGTLQNQVDKAHDAVQDKLDDAKDYTNAKSN